MALGATSSSVTALVLRQGLALTLSGAAIGVLAGLYAARFIATELFNVDPRDPLAFGLAPIVLLIAAVVACVVPVKRALRVDPAVALRPQ
ncbi:MAG TPA: FtsX-like permease family protein, partial [Vicinamibacterales bacterium]|nr:FtsX-like permease family protein [Vicinamibacterales bacterium]